MNDCTKKTLDIIKMVDLAIFWRFGDFLYTMIFIITVLLLLFIDGSALQFGGRVGRL